MKTKTKTQKARILKTLDRGASLTTSQMRKRFGTANPTAAICMLRREGFPIFSETVMKRGKQRTEYRMASVR